MKEKIKKHLGFLPILLLILNSCSTPPPVIQPACTDLVNSKVELDFGYLFVCSEAGGIESLQNMKIVINVDGITYDAAGQTVNLSYIKNYSFNRTNAHDDALDSRERQFDIQLPRCGSYAVTVVARGTDGSCFTCCSKLSGTNTICPNPPSASGQPQFRIVTSTINSDLQNPPPPLLQLKPVKENCACGC
jgi:hypothetical protein